MSVKALVVEDSRSLNELVSEALGLAGFECVSAYDGAEAVAVFEAERTDVVVLDLNLPKIPGIEVLKRIKQINPFAVVVILTGHASEQSAVQAVKLGADDYLPKPVKFQELIASINRHLKRALQEREIEHRESWPGEVVDHWLGRIFFDAPSALMHIDPAGEIRTVNKAAATLLGCKPEELLGASVCELVNENVRVGWYDAVKRTAATGRGYEGELLVTGWDNNFPAKVTAVEKPEKGHLILSIYDLTKQKALERQFFETQKLSSLGRVVEGVAHEVRNPLISIGGFTRKLLEAAQDDSREKRYLNVVLTEVGRLERMVHDIEDYVAFTQRRESSFSEVDLGEMVGEVVEKVELNGFGKGEVATNFEVKGDCPVVFGDRKLLGEVVEIIIENAHDAMTEKGCVQVVVDNVDSWVNIRVEDTGVGIKEEDLDAIFDPFFTSKTSGAGLGLAKAYMIIDDHHGDIRYSSKEGEGTVCTVILPMDRRKVRRTP